MPTSLDTPVANSDPHDAENALAPQQKCTGNGHHSANAGPSDREFMSERLEQFQALKTIALTVPIRPQSKQL